MKIKYEINPSNTIYGMMIMFALASLTILGIDLFSDIDIERAKSIYAYSFATFMALLMIAVLYKHKRDQESVLVTADKVPDHQDNKVNELIMIATDYEKATGKHYFKEKLLKGTIYNVAFLLLVSLLFLYLTQQFNFIIFITVTSILITPILIINLVAWSSKLATYIDILNFIISLTISVVIGYFLGTYISINTHYSDIAFMQSNFQVLGGIMLFIPSYFAYYYFIKRHFIVAKKNMLNAMDNYINYYESNYSTR